MVADRLPRIAARISANFEQLDPEFPADMGELTAALVDADARGTTTSEEEELRFLETSHAVIAEIDRVLSDQSRSVDRAFGLPGTPKQAAREELRRKRAQATLEMRGNGARWVDIVAKLGAERKELLEDVARVYPFFDFSTVEKFGRERRSKGTRKEGARKEG